MADMTVGQFIGAILIIVMGVASISYGWFIMNNDRAWKLHLRWAKHRGIDPTTMLRSKEWERQNRFYAILMILVGIFLIIGTPISLAVA